MSSWYVQVVLIPTLSLPVPYFVIINIVPNGTKPLPELKVIMTSAPTRDYKVGIMTILNYENILCHHRWQRWHYDNSWFSLNVYDDVIKWKHFPRYWPFVRGIHGSPVNSPYKGQWRGALMFSLICVWINGWVNNREAGDLRRYHAHYDVTVMVLNLEDTSGATFTIII